MKSKFYILIFAFILLFTFCSENNNNSENANESTGFKNLNLTILIDLSDRISFSKYPEQPGKDKIIISTVVENFKSFLARKGVVNSEDKIKVIFYPTLNYDLYQSVADSLNIDFSKLDLHERRNIFNQISATFNNNLSNLYSIASKAKYYEGSDLFNYFKHRVIDDCIIDDSNYINVLVILTDGYIYHKNSRYKLQNRYSYLIPESEQVKYFRKMNNWEEIFVNNDYGLLKLDNDLSKLNILVAEVNPISHSPKDFDILKMYWSKWFEEQKVSKSNYKILKTDLTSINKNLINKFFEKITSR